VARTILLGCGLASSHLLCVLRGCLRDPRATGEDPVLDFPSTPVAIPSCCLGRIRPEGSVGREYYSL